MSFPRLHKGGWIVVADGERALILVNETGPDAPQLRLLEELRQENPPTREQGTSRPGRLNDAGSNHKSAVEETDWHRIAKERFAGDIASMLEVRAQADEFSQVIVVAPPAILGALRKAMGPKCRERVLAEIDKDLTKHSPAEIARLVLGG